MAARTGWAHTTVYAYLAGKIRACRPWLVAEFGAAREPDRGQGPTHNRTFLVATAHPSAVLRADNREVAYAALVDDLKVLKRELATR